MIPMLCMGDWDHPRSRGVYSRPSSTRSCPSGSSPLARGLLANYFEAYHDRGIIPARAGFTGRRGDGSGTPGDHPRSRGVYLYSHRMKGTHMGSSLLARGLRLPGRVHVDALRIIPARAGFTGDGWQHALVLRDHPRSRGVYHRHAASSRAAQGSSPLARGLLPRPLTAVRTGGIIPARAGFTPFPTMPTKGPRDHPRSRGVYSWPKRSRPPSPGSSPLARG